MAFDHGARIIDLLKAILDVQSNRKLAEMLQVSEAEISDVLRKGTLSDKIMRQLETLDFPSHRIPTGLLGLLTDSIAGHD